MNTIKDFVTKEDREEAARFYFISLNCLQQDWIESGKCEESIDPDTVALANVIAKVRCGAYKEGFLAGTSALVKSTQKVKK